jgi:hypothetical protein
MRQAVRIDGARDEYELVWPVQLAASSGNSGQEDADPLGCCHSIIH